MPTNEKLSRAPIQEASLKVNFKIEDEDSWEMKLESMISTLREYYPIVNKRILFRTRVAESLNYDSDIHEPSNVIQDGYLLADKENGRRLQIRKGAIEVYKSQPYVEWEQLFSDLNRVVSLLGQVVYSKPSVRYKNVFPLSVAQSDEIDDFLSLKVLFPVSIPPYSEKLALKMDLSDDREGNVVYSVEQIIEASDDAEKPVRVRININVENRNHFFPSANDLVNEFNKLRESKNKLFFSLITEKAKRDFI